MYHQAQLGLALNEIPQGSLRETKHSLVVHRSRTLRHAKA